MNTKSIIASLVLLGSSSVAMADPGVTFSANASGSYGSTAIVRDHRIDPPVATRPVYPPTYPPVAIQPVYQPTYQPTSWGNSWAGRWMPPVRRPVTLASGMHFANDGRSFITVGDQAGRFGTLQLSANGGRTFIKQVYVQFDNGQEQVIRNLDRTLVGNQSLSLDLDGNRRAIRRIVVYGNALNSGWNGWRRAAGTFNVIAS